MGGARTALPPPAGRESASSRGSSCSRRSATAAGAFVSTASRPGASRCRRTSKRRWTTLSATRRCSRTIRARPPRPPPGSTSRRTSSRASTTSASRSMSGSTRSGRSRRRPLEAHELHGERYRVEPAAWARIEAARRVVAVGTTTTRVLETIARGGPLSGRSELFITPGFAFRRVNALLTNFHLPRTTLLALVMAFAGIEETRAALRARDPRAVPLLLLRRRHARSCERGELPHARGDGRRRSRRRDPDRARRDPHAGVHARRHEGHRQDPAPGGGAGARRRRDPRQHLPPSPATGRGRDRGRSAACMRSPGGTGRSSRTPAASRSSRSATRSPGSTTRASRSARSTTAHPSV